MMEPHSNAPLLNMRAITKRFPGVLALDEVDFTLERGEVHVLIGANGAGKSTLMKVLSGVYRKDSGAISIEGAPTEIESAKHAQLLGIATIYQSFSQVLHLTVGENIFLGREPTRLGLVDYATLYREAARVLETVGLKVDPRTRIMDLSISQRQLVEIAKALSYDSKILIMDEPTSALTEREAATLFAIVASLQARGIGIIYISHKIEELKQVGTRVTVMRDGKTVGTLPIANTDLSSLVRLMVGKDVAYSVKRYTDASLTPAAERREVLRADHVRRGKALNDVGLTLHCGEILGLFGLMGAGRTELARALFGVDRIESGTITVDGQRVAITSPAIAVKRGLGFLTEDRLTSGLALCMSVAHNITLPSLGAFVRLGTLLSLARERSRVAESITELQIRTPRQQQQVQFLSGGNQQKVVFAKWLMAQSRILILDEPTQGIDVGAKEEVYRLIVEFTRQRAGAVLFISSELNEILSVSDRILVMHEGRITAEVAPGEATKERLMQYAVGGQD